MVAFASVLLVTNVGARWVKFDGQAKHVNQQVANVVSIAALPINHNGLLPLINLVERLSVDCQRWRGEIHEVASGNHGAIHFVRNNIPIELTPSRRRRSCNKSYLHLLSQIERWSRPA